MGPLLPHEPISRPAVVNNLVDRDRGQGEAVSAVNDEKFGPSKDQCEPVVVTLQSSELDGSEGVVVVAGWGTTLAQGTLLSGSSLRGSESDFRASANHIEISAEKVYWHVIIIQSERARSNRILWGDRSLVGDMISRAISSRTPKAGAYYIPIFQCVFDDAWLLIANTIGLRVGSDRVDQTFFLKMVKGSGNTGLNKTGLGCTHSCSGDQGELPFNKEPGAEWGSTRLTNDSPFLEFEGAG